MADGESDFQMGPGRPPLHIRFEKRQSGNPGGRRAKSLPALPADALNETVVVMIDGRRRKITERDAAIRPINCDFGLSSWPIKRTISSAVRKSGSAEETHWR